MCTPTTEYKLKDARNRAGVPVTLQQMATGVDERVWHHTMERPFPAAEVLVESECVSKATEEAVGRPPPPPTKGWCSQLKGHLHCKAPYLNVWEWLGFMNLFTWKILREAPAWNLESMSPGKRKKKINQEIVKKARERIWNWIQHIPRWMHLQAKHSTLLNENQEGI